MVRIWLAFTCVKRSIFWVVGHFTSYYNWLNQQRLPGSEQSSFLAWFENHGEALAIGPSMPRGTESTSVADLRELLSWMA